jgi:enoyl-CoA hydratase/carnithine racemase
MPHETIRVEVNDKVATITLSRPARLNAYTGRMGIELFGAIHDLDRSGEVRAIVVTGEGRAFCAGADLEAGGSTFAGEPAYLEASAAEARIRPWNLSTPIIGAINGPAVGIGATMPLWWDIRIASEKAKLGFVFTRRGLCPEANCTWLLPRMIGFARAMEILVTGRMLSAEEALAYGLVSRVVPHDELLPAALGIAQEIAKSTAPVAVAATRRLLWRQLLEADPRLAKSLEDEVFRWLGSQVDAAEGVTAFLEKRAPVWSMSAARDLPPMLGDLIEDPILGGEPDTFEVEAAPPTERSDTLLEERLHSLRTFRER